MGQWGAYGMAKGGATYDKILAFYYPGTTLAQSPVKSGARPARRHERRRDDHLDRALQAP